MTLNFVCKILLFIAINKTITSWRYISLRKTPILMNSSIIKKNNNKQCIISSKNNQIYCNSKANIFIKDNEFLSNKKVVTISPGGLKGFYLLGIMAYIKEKYNVDNLVYSGASAGSWTSLFMCYKGDTNKFIYNLLDYNLLKIRSIPEMEYFMKYKLLTNYKDSDFDLRRLFIGVTTLKYLYPLTNIVSDFESLEDAINCCIASSHIPLITGGITNRFHNMYTYDGGFGKYPYLNTLDTLIHISPGMWEEINKRKKKNGFISSTIESFRKFSEFFSRSKNNLLELFDNGYQDAKQNKEYFDSIFEKKRENEDNEFDDDGIIEI